MSSKRKAAWPSSPSGSSSTWTVTPSLPEAARGAGVAGQLRELIDARFREKVTLRQASEAIHSHPAHLVRMFSREFGISPHQYLTGRRVDLARRLLLDGMPPSMAAAAVGFCDQSHLNRSFKRLIGTSPGRYARRRLTGAAERTARSRSPCRETSARRPRAWARRTPSAGTASADRSRRACRRRETRSCRV